jgi:hypothetical protein
VAGTSGGLSRVKTRAAPPWKTIWEGDGSSRTNDAVPIRNEEHIRTISALAPAPAPPASLPPHLRRNAGGRIQRAALVDGVDELPARIDRITGLDRMWIRELAVERFDYKPMVADYLAHFGQVVARS